MPEISAFVSAPNIVMIPATTQTLSRTVGDPNSAAITPGLRKIPEPITPPTTSIVVVKTPRLGRRPLDASARSDLDSSFKIESGAGMKSELVAGHCEDGS